MSSTNDADLLDPLTRSTSGGADDGAASQTSSQRGSGSLLERIQAQRNREQQQQQQQAAAVSEHGTSSTTQAPRQIQVPRYNPVPQQQQQSQDMSPDGGVGGASNLFSSAWSSLSLGPAPGGGMEEGMMMGHNTAQHDALLTPSTSAAERAAMAGEYSMSGYFLTFVRDVYELFQSLPVWARWVVCLVLLYIALKLL